MSADGATRPSTPCRTVGSSAYDADPMFEAVELGRKVAKDEYEARVPELRAQLLQAQVDLRNADFPVIVVLSGVEGAGRGDLLNRLTQWIDMREVEVHAFDRVSDEELSRPEYWRYWRTLPARGRIGIFLNSWYTDPLFDRALDGEKRAKYERRLNRIEQFERMLADDGALILKFWLHLSHREQGRRLKRLAEDKRTRWRVTKERMARHNAYDELAKSAEMAIRLTDTSRAPWYLVEAKNARYRDLTVAQTLADSLRHRMDAPPEEESPSLPPIESTPPIPGDTVTVLDKVDLSSTLATEEYREALDAEQERVAELTRRAYNKGVSTVLVFEGWDAAGKGGAIRRVSAAVDARYTRTIAISAPTPEEKAQHYLWRFWRDVPRPGHVTIYDRSWYGRVLVERVEGFAKPQEWTRAFAEINQFEEQLSGHGVILLKFYLHISPDEQLARFREREKIPYKRHKITDEDWRNRDKWGAYEQAINEMVGRTSTSDAPWSLIGANDKRWARVSVVRTIRQRLEERLS